LSIGLRPKSKHPVARVTVERSHTFQYAAHPKRPRALADGLMLVFISFPVGALGAEIPAAALSHELSAMSFRSAAEG
jgi:hypothetical protein